MTETTDQHLSGAQRREQQIDQRPEVQAEIRNRTRISGLPEYIERGKLHSKRKLRQAIHNGETPLGMMQMGDALHAVEDYFSHSNFVEACIQTLSDRGDPRAAPLMRQLAQVHLADRPDLLFPRDDHGTIQIQTGTYATDEDHSISMLELLSTELQHGYMVRYALLGWFRWMERQGANVGEQLLAAAGGGVGGAIGGVVGGIGGGVAGAVGGAGRGLVGGAAGGYGAGYRAGGGGVAGTALGVLGGGLGAIGGAVSGLFGGAAEGAREGAESGQATGSRLGSAAGGAVGRVTGAALATLVATLPVGVLLRSRRLAPGDHDGDRRRPRGGRRPVRAAQGRRVGTGSTAPPTRATLRTRTPAGRRTPSSRRTTPTTRCSASPPGWRTSPTTRSPRRCGTPGSGTSSTTRPAAPSLCRAAAHRTAARTAAALLDHDAGASGHPAGRRHRRTGTRGPPLPEARGRRPCLLRRGRQAFLGEDALQGRRAARPEEPRRPQVHPHLAADPRPGARRARAGGAAGPGPGAGADDAAQPDDGGGIGGVETEAEWIPDDHEETPLERGVTDLVDKYVCHPNQTEWWVDAVLTPPRRGT